MAQNTEKIAYTTDMARKYIREIDAKVLKNLLTDRTTGQNITFATADYEEYGTGFGENDEILPYCVTGAHSATICPRTAKSQTTQAGRTKNKAEVFTPAWVCNAQNNMVDREFFGRDGAFNTEGEKCWHVTEGPVNFDGAKGTWQDYVDLRRMEISCGEAPYIVSRYDSAGGEMIELPQRVGILDRKLRVVGENATAPEEWLKWAERAVQSVYGFEFQGDSLFLARENVLLTYYEYYYDRFAQEPTRDILRQISKIISWNLWQMDGLKGVRPNSCHPEEAGGEQVSLFGGFQQLEAEECPGCKTGNIFRHNGVYSKIYDWRRGRSELYISSLKGGGVNG